MFNGVEMNPLSVIALKKMMLVTLFLSSVAYAKGDRLRVTLEADRPFIRKMVTDKATLKCCYRTTGGAGGVGGGVEATWIVTTVASNSTHNILPLNTSDDRLFLEAARREEGSWCRGLVLMELRLSDAGLYQCFLNSSATKSAILSHGTFLQVYMPVKKILNISEKLKNNILTAQGILLLLCVLLPGAKLLCKVTRYPA